MTRVLHTGDTHLGYRQYHSAERRADYVAAFRQVIDDAIDDEVDAVIHAGDLYHDRRPGLPDLQATIDVLADLRDAGVPFLGIVGNHEGTREGQWLDLLESLGLATRLDDRGTVVGDVTFYGLDHVPESRRDDLDYTFAPPDTEYAALVSHGLFEPFDGADWDTETVLDESNVAFDVLLLGDNHTPDTARVDGTWVTYSGSTERTSAAEREERGYNLVEFDDDVAISRRAIDAAREFVFVDVELGPADGAEVVEERVRQHEVDDAVVIVTVEGDGEPFAPGSIEELALDRGALVARVNDRREIDDEGGELSVSFADPDDAVRERVSELGLSEAAHAIDGTVRDGTIADTNVRGRVEETVRELLDEDGAFDDAGDPSETAAEPSGVEPSEEESSEEDTPQEEESGNDPTADQASMEEYT